MCFSYLRTLDAFKNMTSNEKDNFHELLVKAERYCAYQERCSNEVKQKLKELDADEETSAKIVSSLSEDDFMSDERFARLFASGKFRIKRWGKNKIRAELRMKKIPDNFIKNALNGIDEGEYLKTIQHLIKKKEKEVKSQNSKDKARKVVNFLLSKGFESELIWKVLRKDASTGSA